MGSFRGTEFIESRERQFVESMCKQRVANGPRGFYLQSVSSVRYLAGFRRSEDEITTALGSSAESFARDLKRMEHYRTRTCSETIKDYWYEDVTHNIIYGPDQTVNWGEHVDAYGNFSYTGTPPIRLDSELTTGPPSAPYLLGTEYTWYLGNPPDYSHDDSPVFLRRDRLGPVNEIVVSYSNDIAQEAAFSGIRTIMQAAQDEANADDFSGLSWPSLGANGYGEVIRPHSIEERGSKCAGSPGSGTLTAYPHSYYDGVFYGPWDGSEAEYPLNFQPRNMSVLFFDRGLSQANASSTSNPAAVAYKSRFRMLGPYCIVQRVYTSGIYTGGGNLHYISTPGADSNSHALVSEGYSTDMSVPIDIPVPDYDDFKDDLFTQGSDGHPIIGVANIVYPFKTWGEVDELITNSENWNWFTGAPA